MAENDEDSRQQELNPGADPAPFINRSRGVSLAEIAAACGGECVGNEADMVYGISPINAAKDSTISFFNGQSADHLVDLPQPSAVLVTPENADCFQCTKILVPDPYLAYARVSTLFDTTLANDPVGIDTSAIVHPDVLLDDDVSIGPFSVVGANCRIGKGTRVGAHVVIDSNCDIGSQCRIGPTVTVRANTRIGNRCAISPGVVLGASGFGYAPSADGWQRISQLGGVVIGDDVDIGANTTIDRGAIDNTVIGNRVKLDNQIQIAHNVQVGDDTIMAGCVAIAGSARIGRKCQLGGRVSILGHLQIADGTILNAGAFVAASIRESGTYSSMIPAQPVDKWRKTVAYINRLGRLFGKKNKD